MYLFWQVWLIVSTGSASARVLSAPCHALTPQSTSRRGAIQSRSRVRPDRIRRDVYQLHVIDSEDWLAFPDFRDDSLRHRRHRGAADRSRPSLPRWRRVIVIPAEASFGSRWSDLGLKMMQETPGTPADDHRTSTTVLLNTFVIKKKRCRVYFHRGTLIWETERQPYSKEILLSLLNWIQNACVIWDSRNTEV